MTTTQWIKKFLNNHSKSVDAKLAIIARWAEVDTSEVTYNPMGGEITIDSSGTLNEQELGWFKSWYEREYKNR